MKLIESYVAIGILLIITGVFMTLNDAADIGSFEHSGDRDWKGVDWGFMPTWVHHWWIGLLIMVLGFYIIYRLSPYY